MSVSLVAVLVSQPVLVCVAVLWYVAVFREWRVLGSILAGAGKLSLLCTGLPQFSMIIIIYILLLLLLLILHGQAYNAGIS